MLLELKNIYKTYYSGKVGIQALNNISTNFDNKEFTAICGPSGSGKTTLLNIMGCIDKPDNGKVFLEDIELTSKNQLELAYFRRRNFGFIFQTYNLIPILTVYENVELPLKLLKEYSKSQARDMVFETLSKVGLSGLEKRKPLELSGGQQQRVSIARALVKKPKIVFADEPTANLDSKTGEAIIALMQEQNEKEGVTFIFSSHDSLMLKHAKRIINLRDGQIVNWKK